jgi:hypothetical protein
LAVLAVTLVVSVAALLSPTVMSASTRDLPKLRAGQWWRIVTPVLVQPDGWGQLVFNLLGVFVVGIALQCYVGWSGWLSIYLVGGVGGIAVVSAWDPTATGGGGSSAAVAASIGALTVVRFTARGRQGGQFEWLAELYSVFFVVYLTAFAVGGLLPSIIAGNASIVLVVVAHRVTGPTTLTRVYAGVVVSGAVLMCAVKDDHGVGIVAGALIAALVLAHRRLRDGPGVWRSGLLVLVACVGVGVASVLTWVAWVRLLGVELVVRAAVGGTSQVGWPAVVGVSISACLAASLVLWRLRRRATSHVEGMWRGACVGVTAVSLLGPLHLAVGASSAAGLLSLHLVCAVTTLALLAPGTRRVAAPAPARPSDATDGSPAFEVQPGRRA